RNAPLAKFPLCIDVTVKFVGIAGQRWIIADDVGLIDDSSRPGTRNDRLQFPDLAILKGVRSPAKVIRKTASEGQLVQGMYPIGAQIIEFPVRVDIALLQGVVGTHA